MHSSWTLPILISWLTVLWPQNSLTNGIRNTKNYKSLIFAAIQDHLQAKIWFNLPVGISEGILTTLLMLQAMSHRIDTLNCVVLLLVLSVAKLTNFCIVFVGINNVWLSQAEGELQTKLMKEILPFSVKVQEIFSCFLNPSSGSPGSGWIQS